MFKHCGVVTNTHGCSVFMGRGGWGGGGGDVDRWEEIRGEREVQCPVRAHNFRRGGVKVYVKWLTSFRSYVMFFPLRSMSIWITGKYP